MTAQSRSAVLSTIAPALPPSSRTTFFLPARSFIRQPDGRAAGEGEELEPVVGDHPVAELAGHRQDAHGARREPDAVDDLRDGQHRERVLRRRLEDDRAARGDRRRDLVGGEVEREVERADARDRADREAAGDADPALRRGHQIERDHLAVHPLGLLGAEPERQRRPIDLDERVADGLAGLEAQDPPELLAPGLDAVADLAQRAAPLVGRQHSRVLEGRHGSLDGLLVLRLGGVVRRARGRAWDRPDWRPPAGRASRPTCRRGRSCAVAWR